MAYVRDTLPTDSHELAPNLREADLRELNALSPRTPNETLSMAAIVSQPVKTIVGDTGNVIGMFGVTPAYGHDLKLGLVWCLTSDELFSIKKQFMKQCRHWIAEISRGYSKICNYVHVKNTKHVRWIKHMGFDLHPNEIPLGPNDEPFYYFEKVL